MLDHLTGAVQRVTADAAVISVGGVGVRVEMPTNDLASLAGTVTVHTVLQIKDENVNLYGFSSERNRELFRALVSVSGVGPKIGLAILSVHGADQLTRAIAGGDDGALALVSGVGKRTAQRIILELKDKVGAVVEASAPAGALSAVREALRGLGYSPQEAQDAVAGLPPDGDVDTLLRHALKSIGAQSMNGDR